MTQQNSQIVSFPFQKQVPHECATFRDGVFQLKMKAAAMLNDVAAGTYLMSPENIEGIQEINEMCRKVGLTPLDYEPSK